MNVTTPSDLCDSSQITQLQYPFGALGGKEGGCPHEAQQNF